jgi:uncharacterized protein YbjQ (UPF0145 family)
MKSNFLVSTTDTLEGYEIENILGCVLRES